MIYVDDERVFVAVDSREEIIPLFKKLVVALIRKGNFDKEELHKLINTSEKSELKEMLNKFDKNDLMELLKELKEK